MVSALVVAVILVLVGSVGYRLLSPRVPSAAQGPLPKVDAIIGGEQFSLEIVTTTSEQNQGLSGRTSLDANSGMLFVFSMPSIRAFWMKDMEFPIDLIWLRGNKIIGFQQNMPTPAALNVSSTMNLPVYISPGLVDRVVEINSGQISALGLKVGDNVQVNLGSR